MAPPARNPLEAFCARLYRARWAVALVPALLAAWLGWHARELGVDPSNRLFFVRHSDAYRAYDAFRYRYGSEETIAVGLRMAGGLTAEKALWLEKLTSDLGRLDGIEEARSLAGARKLERSWPFGLPVEKPFLEDLVRGRKSPDAFLAEVRRGPPEASRLLSADGRLAAIVLRVAPDDEDPALRQRTIEAVKGVLAQSARPDAEFLLSGTAVEQNVFVSQIERDRRTFVPVTVAAIVVLLLLFQTRWQSLLYALSVMAATLGATEGAMALAGIPLHAATSLLSPLILTVAVSSTVQFYARISQVPARLDRGAQLAHAYRRVFLPSALATLTIVVGFGSLLTSQVPSIRQFGLVGAGAAATAWGLAVLWAPAVLGLAGGRSAAAAQIFERAGGVPAGIMVRLRWVVSAAAVVLTVSAVVSAQDVRASTDLLKVFPPTDRFRRDTERLQSALGGIYPVELRLVPPEGAAVGSAAFWNGFERFEEALNRLPNVSHTLALSDAVRYAERALRLPRSDRNMRRILERLPAELEDRLYARQSGAIRELRLTAFLDSSDTARVVVLEREIRNLAADYLAGWRVDVTGQTVLLARMSQDLVRDELLSVAFAFGIILVLVMLALRSAAYALISVVPTALPVAGLFGTMKALDIPLNTATAMIASVVLGLIFDNTIYLICRYRDHRAAGCGVYRSLRLAYARGSHAVIGASAILMGGFGVTTLGSMTPTVQFGLLSTSVIAVSLASNLMVLPALLAIARPR